MFDFIVEFIEENAAKIIVNVIAWPVVVGFGAAILYTHPGLF